ncbi:disabled, partial [Asbolus verrucosus]
MTDSRAFGYIFGSPDTGHRFFGIKTDKAASQVVIAMRDLFQVVFALKKKEIELAKQHLDKGRFTSSPLFSDTSVSSTKTVSQEATKAITSESKSGGNLEIKSGGTAVADLVDLELELNSLQQGLNQMERITPSDPFVSKDDPFGDSFISYTAGNEDWFTPSATVSGIFEEPPLVPEPTKDEKHEMTKQEILSQFDVFTELDPL